MSLFSHGQMGPTKNDTVNIPNYIPIQSGAPNTGLVGSISYWFLFILKSDAQPRRYWECGETT